MTAKSVGLWAVVGLLLSVAVVHGDDYPATPGVITSDPANPNVPSGADLTATPGGPPIPTLSQYILGTKENCCGPIGGCGQIDLEVYLRGGVTMPIAGPIFHDVLESGWVIQGGARSLFFNASDTAAWTIDLSISNMWNHGQRPDITIPLLNILVTDPNPQNQIGQEVRVPRVNVTVRNLNRTFVNLGFGREWYILGTGHGEGPSWRVGFDGGGRWGTANLNTHQLPHRGDVIGGAWASLHTDLECTYGGFQFFSGLRFEWDYTWSDILQIQNNSDIEDVNLMLTAGYRF